MEKSTFIQLQNNNSYDIYTVSSIDEVYCKFYGENIEQPIWVKYACKPWIWFPTSEITTIEKPTCKLVHRSGCWRQHKKEETCNRRYAWVTDW